MSGATPQIQGNQQGAPGPFTGPGRRAGLVATLGLGVPLALLCVRYDLNLSRALVDPTSTWAAAADRYGELPGFWLVAGAMLVAFLRAPQAGAGRRERIFFAVLTPLAFTLALGVSYLRVLNESPQAGALAALALAAGVIAAGLWALPTGAKMRRYPRLWSAARLGLWLAAWNLVFVHPVKLVWGRVRFRDLEGALGEFSPWYLPQGFTGHSSFPSGHVAMAWMLLPLLLLFPRRTAARALVTLGVAAWGLFVAAGRVVIGAHYASDVLFSTLFAFVVALAAPVRGAVPPVTSLNAEVSEES